MTATNKVRKHPKRPTRSALARPTGSVICPCCDGTGKIAKDRMKQTKYTWQPKGMAKAAKKKRQRKTSWLTITTWSSPNGGGQLPAARKET